MSNETTPTPTGGQVEPPNFFGITAFEQNTINHIAAEVSHDFRWDDVQAPDKIRWNNRCVAGLLVTLHTERQSKEKQAAELARLREELKQCSDLCSIEDGGGAVSEVLARKIVTLRATNAGLVEKVEEAFTEGYDAGYSNGGDDVSGFEHGSPKHYSVKEREKKQAWKDSEALAALDAAKGGEK